MPVAACLVTESDLLKAVVQLAQWSGYRVCHFRPARTRKGWRTAMVGDPGWPDVAIVGKGQFILAELKSARGRVRPDQAAWQTALREAGIEVYVWGPRDWESGRIAEALGAIGQTLR